MSLLKLRQIQKALAEGVGHDPESLSPGTSKQWSVCLLPSSPAERGGGWASPSTMDDCKVRHISLRSNKSNQALLKLLTWNLSKVMVFTKFGSEPTPSKTRLEDPRGSFLTLVYLSNYAKKVFGEQRQVNQDQNRVVMHMSNSIQKQKTREWQYFLRQASSAS